MHVRGNLIESEGKVMTAYEKVQSFANGKNAPDCLRKAAKCDPYVLAGRITGTGLIRSSELYKEAKEFYIDETMSCDEEEATRELKLWEKDAIAFGYETKDRDWRVFFLAAFDLIESIR